MSSLKLKNKRSWLIALITCLLLTSNGLVTAQEEEPKPRPKTEELLPETTVVFAEIRDIRDFIVKLRDSNGGKLLAQESVAPLVDNLIGQANDAFNELTLENGVDLTLQEVQSLPAGEINIAVIAPKRKNPVFLFTFEIDEENETVGKVLNLAKDAAAAEEDGGFETETIEEVEFNRLGSGDERVIYFQKDGLLVASNSEDELTAYLDRWMGREVEKIRPLTQNRKFVKIMNRCRSTSDLPADIRLFVDPIELARSGFRGNVGAQAALNFLPVLGLDGLLAVGGTVTFFEGEFESVTHAHMLLSSPKKGIFEMIAFRSANYRPKNWVPEDATLFMSTSWDFKKMFAEIGKIVNTFRGEDFFEQQFIGNINREMGENFYEDVLDSITGKITFVQWAPAESMAFNAEIPVLGIELKEENKFESVMERIIAKIEEETGDAETEVLLEKEYKGTTYWQLNEEITGRRTERAREELNRELGNNPDEGREVDFEIRADVPAMAIVDNELIICSNPEFLKVAIETSRGDKASLAENEDYKNVFRQISRLAGSDMPSLVTYQQPIRTIERLYGIAKSDSTMNLLSNFGEDNKYAANVKRAMEDNPLPPFEEIKHFFQPNGSFVIADESGYHFLAFQMKAPDEPESDEEK